MILILSHQKLDIYAYSKKLVFECYKLTKLLPPDEKFGMIIQIRRAALSVHLNIAEGASRRSENERKRYYEISRSSLIEIDAALDIANGLNYLEGKDISLLKEALLICFKLLTGLLKAENQKIQSGTNRV